MKNTKVLMRPDDERVIITLFVGLVQIVIGIIFLIPPILGAIFFICEVYGMDGNIISLNRLSGNWTGDSGAMSAAPIYLGLMALAGSFIVHSAVKNFADSFKGIVYLEIEDVKK